MTVSNKFFFIDLETTGLDEQRCAIIEVAAVITDHKLNVLEEYTTPVLAVNDSMKDMDTWCRTTHTQSGLLHDVEEKGKHLAEVEMELQRIKRRHFPTSKPPICGNSVHFDKKFLDKHMSNLTKELSHRIIDVSSFMGALSNYHDFKIESRGDTKHRALADIYDSIFYLKGYLERFK
jgi:oligoribonuclease